MAKLTRSEKFKELRKRLSVLNLPVAYHHFSEAVEPPFIVYYSPHTEFLYADGENYEEMSYVEIELYTEFKDFELEDKVTQVLRDMGLTYGHYEVEIKEENMFMQTYTLDL